MTTTKILTDEKVKGEVRVFEEMIAEAIPLIKDYVNAKLPKEWKMVFKAMEQTARPNFFRKKLQEAWLEAFCRAFNVRVKGRSGDPNYNNFYELVHKIVYLAQHYSGKDKHDELMKWYNDGYSVYHVYQVVRGYTKTSKERKDEAKASIAERRAKAEAEAEELANVGNTQGAKAVMNQIEKEEDKEKANSNPEKKEEVTSKSWTAKPIDANKRWIKECFTILRHDPKVFVEMIEHINGKHMLSDRVSNLLISEVQKKFKEAYASKS